MCCVLITHFSGRLCCPWTRHLSGRATASACWCLGWLPCLQPVPATMAMVQSRGLSSITAMCFKGMAWFRLDTESGVVTPVWSRQGSNTFLAQFGSGGSLAGVTSAPQRCWLRSGLMELSTIESHSFLSGDKRLKNKPLARATDRFLNPGAVLYPWGRAAALLYPTSTRFRPDPVQVPVMPQSPGTKTPPSTTVTLPAAARPVTMQVAIGVLVFPEAGGSYS